MRFCIHNIQLSIHLLFKKRVFLFDKFHKIFPSLTAGKFFVSVARDMSHGNTPTTHYSGDKSLRDETILQTIKNK